MSLNISFKSLYSRQKCNQSYQSKLHSKKDCYFGINSSAPEVLPTKKLNFEYGNCEGEYFNTLVKYINKSGYKPGTTPQKIYCIGCGEGFEIPAVYTFFNGRNDYIDVLLDVEGFSNNELKSNIDIKAVEPKTPDLAKACTNYKRIPGIEYINNDSAGAFKKEPDKIDAILIRHPRSNLYSDMLKQSYEKLRKGGILFITTFELTEKRLFENLAEKEKMNIVVNERNTESRTFSDKYVMVLKKT